MAAIVAAALVIVAVVTIPARAARAVQQVDLARVSYGLYNTGETDDRQYAAALEIQASAMLAAVVHDESAQKARRRPVRQREPGHHPQQCPRARRDAKAV